MKHVEAIVIAALAYSFTFSVGTDRFAGAIHRSDRTVGLSGAVHASGMRTQRLRLSGRSSSYRCFHIPGIGPAAAVLLHVPSSRRLAFYAMDAACGRSALRHFSTRAPPAL